MNRRYAILGDIHANLEALVSVVNDALDQGVTHFVCVGDIVGYNADPTACIHIIRDELKCPTVRGNHDHYCSHDSEELADFQPLAASAIAWTRRQLSEADAQWLSALPLTKTVAGFTLVHSTLDVPERWGYVFDQLDADSHFTYQRTNLCFHGHTHIPLVFEKRREVVRWQPEEVVIAPGVKYFINTGSVGQPRDGDPRSSYLIFCAESKKIIFRRVEYDVATTMEKNRKAGLPERLAVRLAAGR
jgi:diadenosine tetraphosphatase ApaH/serine/threonine PP2A family protein phosphatase